MGTGKTSLVLRFVKGQFFDNQVKFHVFFLPEYSFSSKLFACVCGEGYLIEV